MSQWRFSNCGTRLIDASGKEIIRVAPSDCDQWVWDAIRSIPELLAIIAAHDKDPNPCHYKIREAIERARSAMREGERDE